MLDIVSLSSVRESTVAHTFSHFRKLRPQPVEVDQRRQQRRDLDVRLLHDHDDKVPEGRKPWRLGHLSLLLAR